MSRTSTGTRRMLDWLSLSEETSSLSCLRDHARTSLQLWLDGVVPLGQRFVALQSKKSNLIWGRLETARIVAAVEISGDLKSGLGFGGASIVENLLVGIQGLARPVSRDLREETMLDGIPFGSAGGIVGNGYGQGKGVGQLRLELGFPGVTAATVAAAGIGQDEQLAGSGIAGGTFVAPPMGNSMSGKGGSVVRNTDHQSPAIFVHIV